MPHNTQSGLQRTVLIADDDPAMIKLLTHILKMLDFRVITESNGLAAYETAKIEKPDLLILDLMMPQLDGFGVLMRLYGEEPPFNSPAILLTAQSTVDYKNIAESLGGARFIEKPFQLERFIAEIRGVMGE